MNKHRDRPHGTVQALLTRGMLESAHALLESGVGVADPSDLDALIAERERRAVVAKAAGEIGENRRLLRSAASLRMLRDRGTFCGAVIPPSDLAAGYRGKFMLLGLQGNLIPWRVFLRGGDDWHREIVRNFEQEVRDYGFEHFQIDPLGGAFIDCSKPGSVALWGASDEFGACSFETAASLVAAAFPGTRVFHHARQL